MSENDWGGGVGDQTPPDPPKKGMSDTVKVAVITAIGTLLAATVAAGAVVWTGYIDVSSGEDDDPPSSSTTTVSTTSEPSGDGGGEGRGETAAGDGAGEDPGGTTAGGSGAEEFTVSLDPGVGIDLDNQRTATVDSESMEISRVKYDNWVTSPRGYDFVATTRDLTLDDCRDVTEAAQGATDSFIWEELSVGLTFCLVTSESNIAGVTVVNKPPSFESGVLELQVALWRAPAA